STIGGLCFGSNDPDEVSFFVDYLIKQGWCVETAVVGSAKPVEHWRLQLLPAGWEEIRRRPHPASTTGFVAMWFAEHLKPVYDKAIAPAVRRAGYEVRRVDAVEFNGDVVDKILAEI